MGRHPVAVIIGGSNGAGKSTTAPSLLCGVLAVDEFVNADMIATGLSAFHPEGASLQAGKIMLRRLDQLAESRTSFAFESTLSGRTYIHRIRSLQEAGYTLHILFLFVSSVELALTRVAERVRMGGHNVPEEDVRRRYVAGIRNFLDVYSPLAATWRVYDNSNIALPKLVAHGKGDRLVRNVLPDTWERMRRIADAQGQEHYPPV